MESLFDGYTDASHRPSGATPWDEMFPDDATATEPVRSRYADIYPVLRKLDNEELRARTDALARSYLAQGVTFDFAGEERPFPLDVVPRVIPTNEWSYVESGVA